MPQSLNVYNEGNYKQGKKAAFRMRENNDRRNNWQRINLQNIQAAQYQKNKQPNQKNDQYILNTYYIHIMLDLEEKMCKEVIGIVVTELMF